MAFKVQVGPPQISIHEGQTVLVSEPDGQIPWPSEKGLLFRHAGVPDNCATGCQYTPAAVGVITALSRLILIAPTAPTPCFGKSYGYIRLCCPLIGFGTF
jgi:hypothetical protein